MSWQIVGDTFTLFGTGPTPLIIGGTPEPPPPEYPPVRPPPPPPPPPEDNSPFPWSGDQAFPYQPWERATMSWEIPGRRADEPGARMYAMLSNAGNPAGRSHGNAGLIIAGRWAGDRLFAPWDAPPALIRRVLSTGAI